jgi:hypothetical protein
LVGYEKFIAYSVRKLFSVSRQSKVAFVPYLRDRPAILELEAYTRSSRMEASGSRLNPK